MTINRQPSAIKLLPWQDLGKSPTHCGSIVSGGMQLVRGDSIR